MTPPESEPRLTVGEQRRLEDLESHLVLQFPDLAEELRTGQPLLLSHSVRAPVFCGTCVLLAVALLAGGLGGVAAVAVSMLGTALVCATVHFRALRPRPQTPPAPRDAGPPATGVG
ncbi:DUF3040 domain-containing protein [Pseudonocardia acidicola]|uniref:DUF3040 domain-containing protein n=1 Tax=Pseudonocardia acidicola TaxID=2724939 RepID=A0ABX1SHA0_9PSEU|nr:DUF3040 domain-containing protein [Pseudonocardia acidicola]